MDEVDELYGHRRLWGGGPEQDGGAVAQIASCPHRRQLREYLDRHRHEPADMTASLSKFAPMAILAISLPLVVIGIASWWRWAYFHREDEAWMYRAEYRSFILEGPTRGKFLEFYSGHHRYMTFADGQIAEIYIKFPDRKAIFLPDVPEQVIVEYMKLDKPNPPLEHGVSEYREMDSFFFFRAGRLECINLEQSDIKIGTEPDGPFFAIPIAHDDARAAFGRPLRTIAVDRY